MPWSVPAMVAIGVALIPQMVWAAPTLTTIYTFTGGADGAYPISSLIPARQNTFIGTAQSGGASSSGTVFQLLPPAKGSTAWTVSTLYSFGGGADGANPYNIISDAKGNIFGTTTSGGVSNVARCGSSGCGTIFEISPPAAGSTNWTKKTLYSFTGGSDGYYSDGVAVDASGTLYGFSLGGNGSCSYNGTIIGCGTVYRLSPPAKKDGSWKYTLLYTFAKAGDGDGPLGVPLLDSSGAIYGTTASGGPGAPAACMPFTGCSIVFRIIPPATGSKKWTKSILFAFNGTDGIGGPTSLSEDASGNIYGTTNEGGTDDTDCPANFTYGFPAGCGTAFEMSPPAGGGAKWTLTSIWSFDNGVDGAFPYNTGLTTVGGASYSTTSGAYPFSETYGSIVKFTPPGTGSSSWAETTLFTFSNDANGASPASVLTSHGGYLYGTTSGIGQGAASYGTIFRISP